MKLRSLSSLFVMAATGVALFFSTACVAGPAGQRLKERIQERREAREESRQTTTLSGPLVYQGQPYIVHMPRSVPQGQTLPLVIVLHGGLGNASYMQQKLGFDPVADREGMMVAYLNGQEGRRQRAENFRSWNAGGGCCGPAAEDNTDHVSYIDGFIKELSSKYPVDAERIYLAGHSNGAMMSYRFACENPGIVAAIVTVSGPLMRDKCEAPGLQVLHIHGEQDEHVPVAGGRGGKGATDNVVFRSVSDTERMMKAAGADFNKLLVPGANHNIEIISEALTAESGRNLAETIAGFLGGKVNRYPRPGQ